MTAINTQTAGQLNKNQWVQLGLVTAVASVLAVLIVQAIALAIWPDIVLFKPLDSYPRSALFTAVPIVVATALFAWLAKHKARPAQTFIRISVAVLILSFIPDYILPVPHKTLLASTVAAFMHLIAAAVTVSLLVIGYRRQTGSS